MLERLLFILFVPILLIADAPQAPSNLKLVPGATTVDIYWQDDSDGETGFKIFRDDKLIYVTKSDETHFKDRWLVPNMTYRYTVKATDDSEIPPIALDKTVVTDKNRQINIMLRASDHNDAPLRYKILKQPSHGTLSGSAPNLTYTPRRDYIGNDSIRFQVNDGENDSNIAVVTIVVKSDTLYQIYIGDQADKAEKFAASELSHYLSQALKRDIAVSTEYNPQRYHYIIVGRDNNYANAHQELFASKALGEEGYILYKEGGNLLISGTYDRGTLYGVYNYLRKFVGWEWYYSDDKGRLKEKLYAVPLPEDGTIVKKPRFLYRELFAPEGGNENDPSTGTFSAKLMLNGQLNSRTINRILSEKTGWGTDFMDGIYDMDRDMSVTDERINQALENINKWYHDPDNHRPKNLLTYCSIEHVDGGLDGENAEPIVAFTRKVAQKTASTYPNLRVLATAYLWSLEPPASGSTLPNNAGVQFAPIEMDWSNGISSTEYNRKFAGYLKGWGRYTNHILSWLYTTNFNGYLQPMPTIYATAQTIKTMADDPNVEGILLQDSYTTSRGSFTALHAWVYGRLMWNPSLDTDKLVREFCDGYFGKDAAFFIYQYIQKLHQSQKDHPSIIGSKSTVYAPYLNAKLMIESDKLIQEAINRAKASGDEAYLKHVKEVQAGIDYVMLYNEAKLKKEAKEQHLTWDDNHQERFERFKDTIVNVIGLESPAEGNNDIDAFLEAVREPAIAPKSNCPKAGMGEDECIDFQEAGFELAEAHIVYDAKASDHRAATVLGSAVDEEGTGIWAIQLPYSLLLPQDDRHWYLYASVRAEPNPDYDFSNDPNPSLFYSGIIGDDYIEYKYNNFKDNRYHIIKLSDYPQYQDNSSYIWFSPVRLDNKDQTSPLKALYVDRIFAVEAKE